MLFDNRFPYNSEKALAENLQLNSIITLKPLNYAYIKSPSILDALFVGYADKKFICTLPGNNRDNATFQVDFYDIIRVMNPEGDTVLYEQTVSRI